MIATELERFESSLAENEDQFLDFLARRDIVERILQLREKKNVLILGHNYMEPLVYYLSGPNARGDSLALSRYAAQSKEPIILFDGVRFMAETAKILNPEKQVWIADLEAGCSLADPFTREDARSYRRAYPGVPIVTYINSYAEVKAESDFCCTSANALQVIYAAAAETNRQRVIFLPDSLMGANLQEELRQEGSELELIYPGMEDSKFCRCEVHEKFTASQIQDIRKQHNLPRGAPNTAVLVHWECSPAVLREADFFGSTSQMIHYINTRTELERGYLATECEMAANLACEFPQVEFVRSCQIYCQHMRRITLDKILRSLEQEIYEVTVPEETAQAARRAIDRMLSIS